ncbi:MFS transporter [Haliangium sp.]|uniref:MFS transporter n=1 Tax=Haliangium sp. TaxID=2663208 RepID=UPI003D13B484
MAESRAGLPRGRMAGYGAAELGITAIEFFLQFYLLKFYTDVVRLEADIAGLALALAMVWDALTDPLMGTISDQTRSRWGKRRLYILLGAPILGASFVLLFSPPALDTQAAKFAFLLVSYLLVNTGMTIIAVPHAALGGELSADVDERTEIFGWRFLFTNLGLVLGIVLPGLVAAYAGGGPNGRVTASATPASYLVALVLVAAAGVTCWATRGLDKPSVEVAVTLRRYLRALAATMTNRPFLVLVAAYVLGSAARAVNAAVALFYYEYRLGLAEADVLLYVLLPFGCLIAASIILWLRLAHRYGKRRPAVWGIFALGLLTAVGYAILPKHGLTGPIIVAVVGGVLVGAVFLLDSTVADVVDYDEVWTGSHREGMYFGFWRLSTKLARAVGLAASGLLLEAIGFDGAHTVQSPETEFGLAMIFGPGVGGMFMIAALVYLFMPLDRDRVRRVRRILDLRRARRARRAAASP